MNRTLFAAPAVALIVGVAMAANGLAMLLAGPAWYHAVPGVTQTGPFNPHFVEDIGAAYLATGASLVWFAWRASPASRGAAAAGTAFLALHALIHVAGAVGDAEDAAHLARDFLGVFLPPLLAGAAVWTAFRETHHA
jgi:hypothetical protein